MNLQCKIEIGIFAVEASLDDRGVVLQRGPVRQELRWNQVYGGGLLRNDRKPQQDPQEQESLERAAQLFGGPQGVAKMRALQEHFQGVALAYRDDRGHRKILEFPAPVDDPRFLQEITSRLGPSWHGEFADLREAEKKLGTAPGFLKMAFVLIVILIAIALVAFLGLFSLLGPAFNFLSLQRMLLDLQDGEYASFGMRLLTYVVLFVLAVLIRRWLRDRMAARRARIAKPQLRP